MPWRQPQREVLDGHCPGMERGLGGSPKRGGTGSAHDELNTKSCVAWTSSHAPCPSPLDLHKIAEVFHILHGLGLERLNGELLLHRPE